MRFADLKKRLVVSFFAIGLIAIILLFSDVIFVQYAVLAILAFFSYVGVLEFVHFSEKKRLHISKKVLPIFAALLTLSFALFSTAPLVITAIMFFFLFCMQLNKIPNSQARIATSCFSLLYVAFPLGIFYRILYPVGGLGPLADGSFWLFYLLAVTKITDIAAYFGGKTFGKRKIAPKVSPGKTVEGTVIGVVAAVLLSGIFSTYSDSFPLISALVLGLAIGIVGQIGDLAESLFKRDAKVKDSNRLPGLGGVLDMLDSLLFTAPLFYISMGYIT